MDLLCAFDFHGVRVRVDTDDEEVRQASSGAAYAGDADPYKKQDEDDAAE